MPSNGTLVNWLIGALGSLAIFVISILAWFVKKHIDGDETFRKEITDKANRAAEDIAALKAMRRK